MNTWENSILRQIYDFSDEQLYMAAEYWKKKQKNTFSELLLFIYFSKKKLKRQAFQNNSKLLRKWKGSDESQTLECAPQTVFPYGLVWPDVGFGGTRSEHPFFRFGCCSMLIEHIHTTYKKSPSITHDALRKMNTK